jgi:hypothetical protein
VQPSTLKPAGPGRREIDWSSKFVPGHAKEKEERESKNGAVRRELHGEREEELEP